MKSNYKEKINFRKAGKKNVAKVLVALFIPFILSSLNVRSQCLTVSSCSKQSIGESKIKGADWLWFTVRVKVKETDKIPAAAFPLSLTIAMGNISHPDVNVSLPAGKVILTSSVTSATTNWDGTQWVTTTPIPNNDKQFFFTGASFQVPVSGLPKELKDIKLCANFFSSYPGVKIEWSWSGAGYLEGFPSSANYNLLGVKPVSGDDIPSAYDNDDRAGSPENYKAYHIKGPDGGGDKFIGGNGPNSTIIPGQCCLSVGINSTNGTYFCANANTTLETTGNATSFNWLSDGSTGSSLAVPSGQGGTFTVIGTNEGGCSGTASISLQVDPEITVNTPGTVTVNEGDEITLHADVGGGYSFDPMCLTWTGPNGFTANVQGSVGVGPGDVTIYNATSANAGVYNVQAYDCFGSACSASADLTVNVVSAKLAQLNHSVFNIYPNPTHGKLTIQFNSENENSYQLRMVDVTGRIIMNELKQVQQGLNSFDFNVSDYAKGIYVLSVNSSDRNQQIRVVID